MAIIPVDNTHITQSITADAQYLRSVIQWARQRYQSYNQNCTTAAMTAAGITTNDQNFILAFIGDLNRLIQLSGGTIPSSADDMVYNITALLGMQ